MEQSFFTLSRQHYDNDTVAKWLIHMGAQLLDDEESTSEVDCSFWGAFFGRSKKEPVVLSYSPVVSGKSAK